MAAVTTINARNARGVFYRPLLLTLRRIAYQYKVYLEAFKEHLSVQGEALKEHLTVQGEALKEHLSIQRGSLGRSTYQYKVYQEALIVSTPPFTIASIPGRSSSKSGPGIDCLRMRHIIPRNWGLRVSSNNAQ